MDWQQWDRQAQERCWKQRPGLRRVAGHRVFNEFADVVENTPTLAHSLDDGSEIIIQQHHVRRLPAPHPII